MCELWSTDRFQESITWYYLPDVKNYNFLTFCPWWSILFIFFDRQEMLNKSWNFFLRLSTSPTKTIQSYLTPPLHSMALSPRRSWFFKKLNCQFLTLQSNLGVLLLSDCHKIGNESKWCKEATVKISSKSVKVKGDKSLPNSMKWF